MRNKTDWLTRYRNKIKNNKVYAAIVVAGGLTAGLLLWLNTVKTSATELFDLGQGDKTFREVRSNKILEKTFSMEQLFVAPYHLYRPAGNSPEFSNQVVDDIVIKNDEISVNITVESTGCMDINYVMVDQLLADKSIVHKIIPTAKDVFDSTLNHRVFDICNDPDPADVKDGFGLPAHCSTEEDKEGYASRRYEPPTLTVKLNNNSGENILIDNISVDVKRSETNTFPLLMMGGGFGFDFPIFNIGWHSAKNVEAVFNIQRFHDPLRYDVAFKHRLNIAEVEPAYDKVYGPELVLMDEFFKKERVDIDFIRKNDVILSYSDDNSNCYIVDLPQARKDAIFGRFPNGVARVVGKIYFDGQLTDGSWKRDSFYFNYVQVLTAPPIGGDKWPDYYNDYNIQLERAGKNYLRRIGTMESIAPKTADVFTLKLFSGRNTFHHFDVIIRYNGNKEIRVPNFFLSEYVPNAIFYPIQSVHKPWGVDKKGKGLRGK